MTQERMNELANQLEEKAAGVEAGEYGSEDHGGDNDRWCVDLRSAAKKLRAGTLDDFTGSELEEIGCGSDADESEMDELYTDIPFACLGLPMRPCYYVLTITLGKPELIGPFPSKIARNHYALQYHASRTATQIRNEDNGLYLLDVDEKDKHSIRNYLEGTPE